MAIPFKNPDPSFKFNVSKEKSALTRLFTKRGVPKPAKGKLLLASWNVANIGAQGRKDHDFEIIAHIMKRFDLIAVQEINQDFHNFAKVLKKMGSKFDYIMTDTAGNAERLAYVYNKRKVKPRNLFGELALRPREYPKRNVKVHFRKNRKDMVEVHKNVRFVPFDRNPFIGSFSSGKVDFTLANCHLYFGKFQNSSKKTDRARYARRVLEIFALAKWADRCSNKDTTYDKDIILLGDMNVPNMSKDESTLKALIKFGYKPVDYVTKTAGSNLGNDKTYDQMAFAPTGLKNKITNQGVFDFDNAIFKDLWKKLSSELSSKKATSKFNSHVKHHFSDHRPLWVELDVG